MGFPQPSTWHFEKGLTLEVVLFALDFDLFLVHSPQ